MKTLALDWFGKANSLRLETKKGSKPAFQQRKSFLNKKTRGKISLIGIANEEIYRMREPPYFHALLIPTTKIIDNSGSLLLLLSQHKAVVEMDKSIWIRGIVRGRWDEWSSWWFPCAFLSVGLFGPSELSFLSAIILKGDIISIWIWGIRSKKIKKFKQLTGLYCYLDAGEEKKYCVLNIFSFFCWPESKYLFMYLK